MGGAGLSGFIVYRYPVLVSSLLVIWLAALAANGEALFSLLNKKSGPRRMRALALIFAAGLFVRALRLGPAHRLFYDEMEHLNIAQNLARADAFGVSLVGGMSDFNVVEVANYWPAGYHVILAMLFKVLGFSEGLASWISVGLSSLSIPFFFTAVLLAFGDAFAALAAAFALAALPLHVKFSSCTDTTAAAFFWLTAGFAALFFHLRRRDARSLLLLALTLAYAANVRPEHLVLLPLAALVLWRAKDGRGAVCLLATTSLCAGPILALAVQRASATARAFGFSFEGLLRQLSQNVPGNLLYALDPFSERPLLLALGAYGVREARRKSPASLWLCGGAAATYSVVYSAFFIGDFRLQQDPAAPDRYALAAFYLPLLPIAALGAARLERRGAAACAAAFLAFCVPAYGRLSDASTDEPQRYKFLLEARDKLPPDVYVVTFSPAIVNVALRRPAVSPYFLFDNPQPFRGRNLILFQDFWWGLRADASGAVESLLRRDYDFAPLFGQQRGGGTPWAFYRLTPKSGHGA